MKNRDVKTDKDLSHAKGKEENKEDDFPGYPIYPASEDIMNQEEQEDLDVEKVTGSSRLNNEIAREKGVDPADFDESLDIPGAELDDDEEALGEEDEENNFYSLGGDRHEDLEEANDNED
ncbi:hypothetical protein SAMN05428988_2158 [Chitinophaga sp. YR573]|uniref:hypothetical protein n=1 Tax=Chitinophaga sp. YR573 TaxID=1881040 RepID=UPI0008C70141|nr:hypothetical protein [Chitinophaga sp. YR573]SEW11235.1 hypothetical protein SAMN05428988_2158 [Chitinophaga sp. YR573]